MSYVKVENLTKSFPGRPPTRVIDGLDLQIEDGEFFVLLGPSGCGKTTTLRCLAGLERPSSGRISLGDQAVYDGGRRVLVPPERRNIGMVFQSYALWPHMSVRKNVAYPLKARGLRDRIKEGWVEDALRLIDCEHPARPAARSAQRRAAAADRARPRSCRAAGPRAVRRAAQQPRRPAA